MSESHPDYWKIKATELEYQMARQQFEALINKRLKILEDAGLDPNKNWVLDDTKQTITEAGKNAD